MPIFLHILSVLGGFLLGAVIMCLCAVSGAESTYQSGYQDGHADGYQEGVKLWIEVG